MGKGQTFLKIAREALAGTDCTAVTGMRSRPKWMANRRKECSIRVDQRSQGKTVQRTGDRN